ncbi:hypothetical protein Q5P01_006500 [Channa striata]|uniref:Ig-like domain-containing protein n=1 Tax=Channa striata TaxID=64152 RepID=A0AA88NEE8_CHASR|nr:hypothetical protein Q5P01_006500 [Channa striata]
MKVTTLVGVLIVSLTILTGVCTLQSEEIRVQAGEMVALLCPFVTEHNPDEDSKIIWTSYTSKEKYMTYDTSSAEKRQMLICRRNLVILTASVNHQGNYSCSLRNSSSQFWFSLTVNAAQSTANEGRVKYSMTCYAEEPCFLSCPDINTPDVNTLNLIDIVWHKEGDSLPRQSFILSVGEEDSGLYTCTRLYQYHSQIYNMTFAVSLDVKQNGKSGRPQILSPNNNDVFI